MKKIAIVALVLLFLSAVLVIGCGSKEETTTTDEVEKAAEETVDEVEEAVKEAVDTLKTEAEEAAKELKDEQGH